MFTLQFEGSDARMLEKLAAKETQIIAALVRGMDILAAKMLQRVQANLSGLVLKARSGTLRDSAEIDPATVEGDGITSGVHAAGGPAFYGWVHEKGGTRWYDIYPVNKKALAWLPTGASATLSSGRAVSARQIYNTMRNPNLRGRGVALFQQAGGIVVKHVHHPPLRAQPFMKPAQDDTAAEAVEVLQTAVNPVLKS